MDLEFGPSTDLENPQDCMTKYSLLINLTCYQNSSLRQSGFLMSETDASHCFTMLDNPIKHVLLSEKVCWGVQFMNGWYFIVTMSSIPRELGCRDHSTSTDLCLYWWNSSIEACLYKYLDLFDVIPNGCFPYISDHSSTTLSAVSFHTILILPTDSVEINTVFVRTSVWKAWFLADIIVDSSCPRSIDHILETGWYIFSIDMKLHENVYDSSLWNFSLFLYVHSSLLVVYSLLVVGCTCSLICNTQVRIRGVCSKCICLFICKTRLVS